MDDRSGKELDARSVRKSRKKEIETLIKHRVYDLVPRRIAIERCRVAGCKLIDVRWLDVDKAAPGEASDVQSRCVAKEFATSQRDDIFAGTPSLESAKLLLSMAATGNSKHRKQVMVMDVERAFLHAPMTEEMYINLPSEALSSGETEPMVGILRKALYGTRNAPQSWQEHITTILVQC